MNVSLPLGVWITGPLLLQEGLRALLASLPGFINWDEVGGAPDVILAICVDHTQLRDLTDHLNLHPSARVLGLSPGWTPEAAMRVLQAGAIGCLNADLTPGDLAAALRQAARGEIVLSADLQRAIVLEMARSPASTNTISFESLSEREQEVLVLICQGLSNKQIAQQLYLSVRTVENHLRRLYQKLRVSSRTEAAVLAVQQGWITPD